MTLLAGDINQTGYSAGGSSTDGGYLTASPFFAGASGQATSLNCWINPITPGGAYYMALYDGSGQLLVYSGAVVPTTVGQVSFPITNTPIVAGQAYQVVLASNAASYAFGVDGSLSANTWSVNLGAVFPTPTNVLPGLVVTTFVAPAFYIDGNTAIQPAPTSGSVSQTNFKARNLVDAGFDRCKIHRKDVSDEMLDKASNELFMLLSEFANYQAPLWAVDSQLLPMTNGVSYVPTPVGTINVLNANYRTVSNISLAPNTPTITTSQVTFAAASATQVNSVSITWSGSPIPIWIQQSPDGVSWTTLLATTPVAQIGGTTYHDLDGATANVNWRVIPQPVPSGQLLQVSSAAFYTTLTETPMYSFSRDEWVWLGNHSFAGTPRQYWLDRQIPWPVMRLWPVPQLNDQQNGLLVVWRHRHIMDLTSLTQRVEIPQNWYAAVADALAERLSIVCPEVDPKWATTLPPRAIRSLALARGDNRESGPMKIVPQISRYTR